MNSQFLSDAALRAVGFAGLGDGVQIHSSCVFVGPGQISIGDRVRIDPFCVITARDSLNIGNSVHIASHCSLVGAAGITIGDFTSLSHGVRLFSESDDLSASALIGSQAPRELRAIHAGRIVFGTHACIGAGGIVLPGVHVGEGAITGALALVRDHLEPWSINVGSPSRRAGSRDRDSVLALAARLQRR